jgi:hypothetical protein
MQEASPFDVFTLGADHVSHFSLWFFFCLLLQSSDLAAFTSRVGLPNKALKEVGQAREGHLESRPERLSPNRNQPNASIVKSG